MSFFSRLRSTDGQFQTDAWQVALCVACFAAFIHSVWYLSISFGVPVLEMHGFRQSQTAISAYWIGEGGSILSYETPVLGAPWSVPFEAPVYQLSVVFVANLTGLGMDDAGRLTSFIYLLGSIWMFWMIIQHLTRDTRLALLFTLLTLTSSQYLFWGRSFLIETCSVFYCSLFLLSAIKLYDNFKTSWLILCLAGCVLGALAKATTWPAFVIAFGIFWLWRCYQQRAVKLLPTALIMAIGIFTLVSVLWWNHAADIAKVETGYGKYFTSENLNAWNYGTVVQRFSPVFWLDLLPSRMIPESIGRYWWILLPVILLLMSKRNELISFVILSMLYLSGILLFINLHMVHNYYQTACAVFLVAATGVLINGLFKLERPVIASLVLCALVVGQLQFFYGARYIYTDRDVASEPGYQTGIAMRDLIDQDRSLFVFGLEWSSEVHYYSQRKGIAFASRFDPDMVTASLEVPAVSTGELPLGGAVDCRGMREPYPPALDAFISTKLSQWVQEGAVREQLGICDLYMLPPFRDGLSDSLATLRPSHSNSPNLLRDPTFQYTSVWILSPRVQRTSTGLLVTDTAVATQLVEIEPGATYNLDIVAKCADEAVQGRLQVNWLAADRSYLATKIETYQCRETARSFSMSLIAPEGAALAHVYVNSDEARPVIVEEASLRSMSGYE